VTTHAVWLRSLPLDLHALTAEHSDELRREFALLRATAAAAPAGDPTSVPARLLDLMQQLAGQYQEVADEPTRLIDEAIERGDASIDLVYNVPRQVGPACQHLAELFDEADEFCRRGDHLLTLETPPAARAYRTWFLQQFTAQIAGEPAEAWNEWARANAPLALAQP
jgi:hypothetical protein